MLYIALVRHGEAIKNYQGRHGAGLDSADESLTPEGIAQAEQLGAWLHAFGLPLSVWMPPQAQCQRTGAIIARGAPLTIIPDLASIGLGELRGLPDEVIASRYPAIALGVAEWQRGLRERPPTPPGGEELEAFLARVGTVVRWIVNECDGLAALVLPTSTLHAARYALRRDVGYVYRPVLLGSLELIVAPRPARVLLAAR